MDPRRIRTRPALLLVALTATLLGALAVGWAALATVRERAFQLLPLRVAADLTEQVGAAIVVAGLLAGLAAVALAAMVARWLGEQLEGVRKLATGEEAAPPSSPPAELLEVRALAQTVRERVLGEAEQRRRLERERDQLTGLLEGVGEGILQLDPGGRVVRANPAARALLSLPDAPGGEVFAGLVRHRVLRRLVEEALSGGAPDPAELALNGRRLLVVTRPLGQGPPPEAGRGVAVSLVDLTEMKRLESVRRDFVANASHELKTPLTSIRGYAETLLSDDVDPEMRIQFLTTIRDNSRRLQSIVDDLLDLSRLESGGWAPDLQDVRLDAAVRDAWLGQEDRASARDVLLLVDGSAEREVRADPLALRQILTNLLDNALRHTSPGGEIRVRARAVGLKELARAGDRRTAPGTEPPPRVAVEVSDTGTGIPSDALPRIFERFYRVDPARSRSEGGTGLGLAIVKHLVETMGGSVEAESELGHGTTVRLHLPAPHSLPANN